MGVFCDRLKLCSTAALYCRTGQNKGRYREKELLFTRLVGGDGPYVVGIICPSDRNIVNVDTAVIDEDQFPLTHMLRTALFLQRGGGA